MAKNRQLYSTDRFNNVGKYMGRLMKEFRKAYNATTLELPMTEEYFDLPINDTLFEEWDSLSRQEKPPKSRNQPNGDLVYERKAVENRVEKHYDLGVENADFKFHLKFGKLKQVFRMKENLAKIILNLLNGLSLWLSISFFQSLVLKSGLFGKTAPQGTTADEASSAPKANTDLAVIETAFESRYNSL